MSKLASSLLLLLLLLLSAQLLTNPSSLSAIVDDGLLKPRVLEGLLGGDTILRIIDKDLLKQVQELSVETVVGWNEFLRPVSTILIWNQQTSSNLHEAVSSPSRICGTLVTSLRSDSRACFG